MKSPRISGLRGNFGQFVRKEIDRFKAQLDWLE
jgi:hypothetical protein